MELELGSFSAVEVIINPTLPQLQENSRPGQVVFKPSAEIITAYLLQSDNILNICLTMFRMKIFNDGAYTNAIICSCRKFLL